MPHAPPKHSLSLRRGLLYAAGDIGPSITSLCLAFYWLYFLIEVAAIPTLRAGLIHASGYVFSAFASLWAGDRLDRRFHDAEGRCRLIAGLGFALALSFFLLWTVPEIGAWKTLWYLALSWLFHLLFALVYLAYLSLTPALAASDKERVDLNSYRFGGTMLLTLTVLGLHSATEGIWSMPQRLLALGGAVALLAALGSMLCGVGLKKSLGATPLHASTAPVSWGAVIRSRVLWSAVGGNLAVWFMVQTVMVLTIFLCKAAKVSDARILLLMQFCIILSAVVTSVASRRWSPDRVIAAAAVLWCVGAVCWWNGAAPLLAAMLLGLGLGAATVISWAKVPDALDRFAESASARADARAYAGLTVLRDLVSAVVPLLATLAMDGLPVGSPQAGKMAAGLLVLTAVCAALALPMLQLLRQRGLRAADDGIAEAPR